MVGRGDRGDPVWALEKIVNFISIMEGLTNDSKPIFSLFQLYSYSSLTYKLHSLEYQFVYAALIWLDTDCNDVRGTNKNG